ncbi:MAG: TetR/AcrR family transcriptional regulator [Solirubrobacteraceae bacterium]|nr:TetR/AcrR family transcriptional regulator [Solirubrobacteraceae bacterium]
MTDPGSVAGSRRDRRKAETRAKLIGAAREVFARQGVDPTSISEITEAADVGFGSFYNHFAGKDAIVEAIVEEASAELGEVIDEVVAGIPDAAEVVAVSHRVIVELAASQPSLGWLMVRLEFSHDMVSRSLAPKALRDIDRGIADGRFVVDDLPAALIASGGALLAVVRAVLAAGGPDPGTAAVHHAAAVLRILGLEASEARRVAERTLPAHSVI